jgi:serine/threonine protein kinase
MKAQQGRAKSIFLEALDIPSASARQEYVAGECAGDDELRREVEELLEHHRGLGSFLESAVSTPAVTVDEPGIRERPGTVIGPYQLLEPLGEGGFGIVFLAEQRQPLRRQVALKVVKPGMDSRQVVARFEAERQALALMDHPNIAHVLEGGETASGRPYFVMELVRGLPITWFCDQEHLVVRERLELFITVCSAVQHAHQKGIIHRDLKPSNVLVTSQDGKPGVKVIDFGIAKVLGQQLPDRTQLTCQAQMVGTPLYMSPEQAGSSGLDIDTRTDVYALGVLLYELLTGTTPFDRKRLGEAGYDELRRIIREEEPPRPSTRLSTTEELPAIAANRGLEPRKLAGLVRGELDWIVMRCLEKDRDRRYESASALALDVERYLHDEPVLAGPPSARYKVRKFVRRHRGPVLAAALVLLALVGGTCAATWGLVRAERARQVAEGAQEDAEAAAEEERKAKETAQKRLVQIEKANAILAWIFYELDPQAEEKGGPALRVQLGKRLDQAARLLEGEVIGNALTVAAMQHRLGASLQGLGHYDKALLLLQKAQKTREVALGPDHPLTLYSKNNLAVLYRLRGKYEQAEPLLLEVLRRQEKKHGADHPDTLQSKNNLALLYKDQRKYDQAVALNLEVLQARTARQGPDHPDTLTSKNNLAALYLDQGKYDRAEPLFLEVLGLREKTLGANHPDTLQSKNNLTALYQAQGKYARAEPLLLEVLRQREKKLGADHPHTLQSKNNLAALCKAQKKYDRAEPLYLGVLRQREQKLGVDHPDTLHSKYNLAAMYQAQRKYDRAEPLYLEVLQARTATLGADHPDTITSMNALAVLYWFMRKLDRSVPLFEETLRLSAKNLGVAHPRTINRAFNLGANYRDAGRLDHAVALFEEWLGRSKTALKAGHPTRQFGLTAAAETYGRAGRHEKVEPLLRELAAIARQVAGADSPTYAGHLAPLGLNLLVQRKHAEAETALRECLAIRQKKLPEHWVTFNTQSLLGAALLGQKKYAEAEPLLVQGYQGMKQRQARIPKEAQLRLSEALERLVQLYDAWGKKDEAANWRKQLEAVKSAKPAQQPKEK